MANGIYNAVSGAVAQTRQMEIVANNLANISTAAFKADRAAFTEVLARAAGGPGPAAGAGAGSFVKLDEVRMDLRGGGLRPTEDPMDLALEGPGYLTLRRGDQMVYSRGGRLQIRQDGVLADDEGLPLLDREDKIVRPGKTPGKLTITADGTVRIDGEGVARLRIVEFARPELLERLGTTRYRAPAAAAEVPAALTRARQGHIERSNINPVRGVTSMVTASRTYEAFHRLISTFHRLDSRTATTLGRST